MVTGWRALVVGAAAGAIVTVVIGFATHFAMGDLGAARCKATIALGALALVGLEARRARERRRLHPGAVRFAAAALAVLAVGSYYNFGNPVYDGLFHRNNLFHHYLGAKYPAELSYTRLYACTAVAEADLGHEDEVRARRVRDLTTDGIVPGAALLDHREDCVAHFTPARWEQFKEDVRWFRGTADRAYWDGIQLDHGYNAPPVWTAGVHVLTSLHTVTRPFVLLLASLDLALYVGAVAAIAWAFRWRVACLSMIFWACQHPANHTWVSGSLLRHDWLFFLIVSVCFLKKRSPFAGGATFAIATLLRLFPLVTLAGPLLVIGAHVWRKRHISRSHARFALGGLVAAVALVGFSFAVVGPRAYVDFASHIRVHERTPSANQMGLAPLFMHDFSGGQDALLDPTASDPFVAWRAARGAQLRTLYPFYALAAVALLGAFLHVTRRRRALWTALALSVVVVFAALRLSSYYLEIMLVPVLLARVHRPIERLALGAVGFGALCVTMPALSGDVASEFATQSVVYLVFLVLLLASLWRTRTRRPPVLDTTPRPRCKAQTQ